MSPESPKLPNLFDYATKELSQDAFICWLLRWADPLFAGHNPELHRCGRAALAAFYATAGRSVPGNIQQVIIHRQYRKIDIWVEIRGDSESHALLIEDKVGSGAHSGQLTRYREMIPQLGYDVQHLLCIFFKTFDQCDYGAIQAEGFYLFDRAALLRCIEPFTASGNAILHDFYYRMRGIEDRVESFRTTPITEWEGEMWVGFYKALRQQMPAANWERVYNPARGYWSCCWGWGPRRPYFQLRERQAAVCATAEGDAEAKRRRQQNWHRHALEIGREFDLPLERPNRIRVGKSMTLAVVSGEYRQTDANGLINLDATVAFLRRFDALGSAAWD